MYCDFLKGKNEQSIFVYKLEVILT